MVVISQLLGIIIIIIIITIFVIIFIFVIISKFACFFFEESSNGCNQWLRCYL